VLVLLAIGTITTVTTVTTFGRGLDLWWGRDVYVFACAPSCEPKRVPLYVGDSGDHGDGCSSLQPSYPSWRISISSIAADARRLWKG
jgi:hypothetical protein